jgi:nucleoid-associated protein YgaU
MKNRDIRGSSAWKKEYTVKDGDTLSNIAQKFYGDPDLYHKIYEANKDVIGDNPDLIKKGMVLTIPPK